MVKATVRKSFLIIILAAIALLTGGCEETTSVVGLDKVNSSTHPQPIGPGVKETGLSYTIGESPYDAGRVIMADHSGLIEMSAKDAFNPEFIPQAIYSGQHFFSMEDDPVNYMTRMSFVSRNVFKRTDVEYRHKLPLSGCPILKDDATMMAAGVAGKPGEGRCYLGLLELITERFRRAAPEGFSNEELESGRVIPLVWEGKLVHALLILEDGGVFYFKSDQRGEIAGSIELADAEFPGSESAKAWLDPSGQAGRLIIGIKGGYFVVDSESMAADYFRLSPGANVLGPTIDAGGLIWAGFDGVMRRPVVRRRDSATGVDGKPMPYGKGLAGASTTNVLYSPMQDCIYFESGGDIWRMGLKTGIQGKFTDTADVQETLLWAL
jgi:hypothetical protein